MERELEKRSGVFKVERQVFTHQAEFDSKFHKVDVSPKPVIGKYYLIFTILC